MMSNAMQPNRSEKSLCKSLSVGLLNAFRKSE